MHSKSQLTLNFNINEACNNSFRDFRDTVDDLLIWIRYIIDDWHDRRGNDTPREDSDVIVRFWLCSMKAYDQCKPVIKGWSDGGIYFGRRAKTEFMFYERKDGIPFPNKACVAGASVLENYTGATGWQSDGEAIRLARHVSSVRWYRDVDVDDPDWLKTADTDCVLLGESPEEDEYEGSVAGGDDSDGEVGESSGESGGSDGEDFEERDG